MTNTLSHALRHVLRNHRVTAAVVGTIAIATSVSTLLVAMIGAALTVHVPLVNIDTLFAASRQYRSMPIPIQAWPYPTVSDLIAEAKHTRFAGFTGFVRTVDTASGPRLVRFEAVTNTYADVMGVFPDVGRWFVEEENRIPLRDYVVVVSAELCRRISPQPRACLGSLIRVGPAELTVIGVMPRGFKGLRQVEDVDAWTPIMLAPLVFPPRKDPASYFTNPKGAFVGLIGRIRTPGDLADARSELTQLYRVSAIRHGVADASMDEFDWSDVLFRSVRDTRYDPTAAEAARIAEAAVLVLLLMTCANITLLLVADSYARAHETAIQLALGATLDRVLTGLALEMALMTGGGLAAGLALARSMTATLERVVGIDELHLAGLSISLNSLRHDFLTSGTIVAGATVVALLISILTLWRVVSGEANADSGPLFNRLRGSLQARRWQGVIISAEVCCAVCLTIVSGLLIASYSNAIRRDLGFLVSDQIGVVRLSSPVIEAATDRRLVESLAGVGGIDEAARLSCMPLSRQCIGTAVTIDGDGATARLGASLVLNRIDPAALQLLGIALREGRAFTDRDSREAEHVAILSYAAAKSLAIDGSALGKRIVVSGAGAATVVGIASDVKYDGLTEQAKPAIYVPWDQYPQVTVEIIAVHTLAKAAQITGAVRGRIEQVQRELATSEISAMPDLFSEASMEQRLQMLLLVVFAITGIVLYSAGLIGVTGFVINTGIREIGVRLAIGATPHNVIVTVFRRIGRFVVSGLALGILLSWSFGNALKPLLYQVSPLDLTVFLGSILLTALVAGVSIGSVAMRLFTADPAAILRSN